MPIRTRRPEGGDRVGSTDAFCICGINLLLKSDPVHCDILEAFLTGRYNPFTTEAPEKVKLYHPHGRNALKDCYYASLWNLAAEGISRGSHPSMTCAMLRSAVNCHTYTDLTHVVSTILPFEVPENDIINETLRPPKPIDPSVTHKVIEALAEEGILEDDAKTAVTELLQDGTLRRSNLQSGSVLFSYGDERRRIVSRILNRIHANREARNAVHACPEPAPFDI